MLYAEKLTEAVLLSVYKNALPASLLTSHNGVCRTAPATLDLFISASLLPVTLPPPNLGGQEKQRLCLLDCFTFTCYLSLSSGALFAKVWALWVSDFLYREKMPSTY